ncbi:peptidase M50B-like-domain-containing protein [Zopfochytrium polystomum]|nr:peptidase M50B-like-domain-containing protein [Zopfochytrium polystomum]
MAPAVVVSFGNAVIATLAPRQDSQQKSDLVSRLTPNAEQWQSIYFIIGFTIGIAILWHLPIIKYVLWPFKVFTVALHEFGHAAVGRCTGAKVQSITVDPDEGGLTKMLGGNMYLSLPAGYLSSAFFGAVMIFCGFNLLASKIVVCVVGLAMLLTLFWAKNWLTRGITVIFIGAMAFFWWFDQSLVLRYIVLFLGCMSSFYAVWDIVEDLVVRKVNESDASAFSRICCNGCIPPQLWGFIWFLISLIFIGAAIIAAIIYFKDNGQ